MTRVADTSALYALFDRDDAYHGAALEAVEDPEPIVVPTEILVETIDLITSRTDHGIARAALEDLTSLPHVTVGTDAVRLEPVREIHATAGGTLSLADAFVVQACRALGAQALGFDATIDEHVGQPAGG